MQYMCLIYSTEGKGPAPDSPEFGPFMKGYMDFTEKMRTDGKLVSGDALQPIATATTVTVRSGKTHITDGPFAETKEQLGGFYILECADLDDALACAALIPTADYGRIEVRPLMVWDN